MEQLYRHHLLRYSNYAAQSCIIPEIHQIDHESIIVYFILFLSFFYTTDSFSKKATNSMQLYINISNYLQKYTENTN